MNQRIFTACALLISAFLLVACGHESQGGVAVIDLSVVAAETGQDEEIRVKADEARNELTQQLQQIATALDGQLLAEREKFGDSPSAEEELQLQQMNLQARQQLIEAQTQAQTQVTQIEQNLIEEFRAEVTPLAQELAQARGASIVLARDAYLFWAEDSIDITADVVAAWNRQASVSTEEIEAELEEAADAVAEATEELQEAEESLEQLEGALDDSVNPGETPTTE